jgi:hypothetical protein
LQKGGGAPEAPVGDLTGRSYRVGFLRGRVNHDLDQPVDREMGSGLQCLGQILDGVTSRTEIDAR